MRYGQSLPSILNLTGFKEIIMKNILIFIAIVALVIVAYISIKIGLIIAQVLLFAGVCYGLFKAYKYFKK